MDNIYKNVEEYNPNKKPKILIIFGDIIADMLSNKKRNSIVTELFTKSRKLNVSFVFIRQSYFKVPKDVRLNDTHFYFKKIENKREFQQTANNHSSDMSFMNFFKKMFYKTIFLFSY